MTAFRDDRVALIPYLTGGYPTLEGAREVGEAYVAAGADVVEIGVPFSDPLADGPTIQETTTLAIENGADLNYCLDLASTFSDRVGSLSPLLQRDLRPRHREVPARGCGGGGLGARRSRPARGRGRRGHAALFGSRRSLLPARGTNLDGRAARSGG